MQRAAWILLLAATGLGPARAASAQQRLLAQSHDNNEVTVHVGKLCPAAVAVWKISERTARDLYSRAGVKLRFTYVVPPVSADAIDLWVVNRAPKILKPDVMGTALASPEYDPLVYVFYDRVARFYTSANTDETGTVMGYVIAHELGHILRGEGHSPDGVMKARWNLKDVAAMLHGIVEFSGDDSDRIRRVVAERRLTRRGSTPEHWP